MKSRIDKIDKMMQEETETFTFDISDEQLKNAIRPNITIKKGISSLTHKKISEHDIDLLKQIFMRHHLSADHDIYGRTDIGNVITQRLAAKAWPPLTNVNVLMTDPSDFIEKSYWQMGNQLVQEYSQMQIEKNIILSPDQLNHLPVINITTLFPKNITRKDPTSQLKMKFDEREITEFRRFGWKLFIPYYKEQFIRINNNRYVYLKTISVDKKTKTLIVFMQIYTGNTKTWLCSSQATFTMHFSQNEQPLLSCDIDANDIKLYEHLLSETLPSMKWNKLQLQLWTDMFESPERTSDLIPIMLLDKKDASGHTILHEQLMLAYGQKEKTLIQKVFGDSCQVQTGQNIQNAYASVVRKSLIPDYINIMCMLATVFQETPVTETTDKGIIQTFGKIIVTAATPVVKKEM